MLRAIFLVILLTASISLEANGDSRPSGLNPDVDALPPNAAQIYRDTTLFPRQAKWLAIPWLTDLPKAMKAGGDENRPLLIWVSGDDPLERC